MFGAQFAPARSPTASSFCAGSVDSSVVNTERKGIRFSPAWLYCLTRLTPIPPGMKVKKASGLSAAILASSAEKSNWPSGV